MKGCVFYGLAVIALGVVAFTTGLPATFWVVIPFILEAVIRSSASRIIGTGKLNLISALEF